MSTLGLEAKLYYAADGVGGTNHQEIELARDVTVNMDKALTDTTVRKNNGWRAQRGTLKQGTIDCQLLYDPANADWQFLQNLFFTTSSLIELWALDGTITPGTGVTSQGLHAVFDMNQFNQTQNLEEAIMHDCQFTIADEQEADTPEWFSVTGT